MIDDPQPDWLDLLHTSPETRDVKVYGYETVPPGWSLNYPLGLSEHLLYLVVAGSCEGTVGDHPVHLDPGSLLWLRSAIPFALTVRGGRPPTLYRFRLNVTAPVGDQVAPVTLLAHAWELRGLFDTLVAELGADLPFRDERVRASLVLLFTQIFRLARRGRDGQALDQRQRQRLEDYVDQHITERIQPADLALAIGLSPQYFTRRFRHTYGMPPKVWLVRRRIQHAAFRLDESQDSVSVIARRLGYPDVFLFSRQFKSVMGVSPRRYRSR